MKKTQPFRDWQDTLPFHKRLLTELITLAMIVAPISFIIYLLTGDVYLFFPSY
jgi:hypothetical protein